MKLHTIAAVALVVLVATVGVTTATPGNAPVDPGADDPDRGRSDGAHNIEPTEHASAGEDHDATRSENASATGGDLSAADARGPGEDLPAQVPDHVARLHDLIRQHLGGTLDGSLGEVISGVAASDGATPETAADASG